MIRWVPAKSSSLGQTTAAFPAAGAASTPSPEAQSSNQKSQALVNGIVYGGLVLAGLAFLWAITMSATPESD